MMIAATFDYIESDFADARETLGEYRTRTCEAPKHILVRRVCRALRLL